MKPEKDIARIIARLDSEAKQQVALDLVHCAQHGPQYTCAPRRSSTFPFAKLSCGHIACRQIKAGNCPECEAP